MVQEYTIKLATIDDMREVFELSNDELVRKNSIHQEKITWNEHVKWYNNKLNDKNSVFYIIKYKNVFAGYCRLDKENSDWIITIHVSSSYRGKGIGTYLINYVCKNNSNKNLVAYAKVDNEFSCKLFSKTNFKNVGIVTLEKNNCYKFIKRIKNIIAISNQL